jgi:Ni,Fe-hydrogenase I large subunit
MNDRSVAPEGCIRLRLAIRAGAVCRVDLHADRPRAAEQLFRDRPIEQVLQSLPLLFGVCATAQGSAAVQACEQALGLRIDPGHRDARALLVDFESAREHLLRVLLDWHAALGDTPHAPELASVARLNQGISTLLYPEGDGFHPGGGTLRVRTAALRERIEGLTEILERSVFGLRIPEWWKIAGSDALAGWAAGGSTVAARLVHHIAAWGWSRLGQSDIPALPATPAWELHARFCGDAGFTSRPNWNDTPCETGASTRQRHLPLVAALAASHGNGLLTRTAARLCELAVIHQRIVSMARNLNGRSINAAPPAPATATGVGLAQVEAARGRLVHRVELEGPRVRRYQILAPTEWNFHPNGAVARGLMGLPADDRLEERVGLLIQSVDPCVGWRLEVVGHA